MWVLGALFAVFLGVTNLILPWLNRSRIRSLTTELENLQTRVRHLESLKTHSGVAQCEPIRAADAKKAEVVFRDVLEPDNELEAAAKEPTFASPAYTPSTYAPSQGQDFAQRQDADLLEILVAQDKTDQSSYSQDTYSEKETPSLTFEQLFGGKAFVWMGGIALALAGFYLVKYSIETGLLTENIRVILGGLFGFGLLFAGKTVRQHPAISDGTRIAQALSGAGLAVLYGTLFAATSLYHIIPSWLGFLGMTIVTAGALLLSLLCGAPIAALGLIGGFATPMIMHGEPNAPLLFGYLLIVFGGLMAVIRRQGWWWLSLPAVLISFIWVGVWLLDSFVPGDGIWLALFLMGITATVVMADAETEDEDLNLSLSWLRYGAFGGSCLLMGAVTWTSHFDNLEWGMFGLFALATYVLAWAHERMYSAMPWIAMGANAVMLLAWNQPDPASFALVFVAFGLLHAGGSYLLMKRSDDPLPWASLCAVTTPLYYLIAYYKLDPALVMSRGAADTWFSIHEIWCALALGISLLFIAAIQDLFVTRRDVKVRQQVQAVFTCTIVALLSSGLAIALDHSYWSFVIAAEILTVSWLQARVDMPFLRTIGSLLLAVFGLLMLPDALGLVYAIFGESMRNSLRSAELAVSFSTLSFRFVVPALMMMAASWFLRQRQDDELVETLEYVSATLLAITGYKIVSMAFGNNSEFVFAAQSYVTLIWGVMALASFQAYRIFNRHSLETFAYVLAFLTAARLVGYALLLENPLWAHQAVGTWYGVNYLLTGYGMPVLLAIGYKNEMLNRSEPEQARLATLAALVLSFVFVSMNVRQFYHGTYLDGWLTGSAEIYTYSAAWLVLGIGLLLAGVIRQNGMMRVASLPIMLLTVGKVFLYDASELTGLLRVFSFFGLGLCLLGLSWFYSKFVFGTKTPK